MDELASSSISNIKNSDDFRNPSKQINKLAKDQEVILEAIMHVNDPQFQRKYIYKLFKSLGEKPLETPSFLPSTSKNTL